MNTFRRILSDALFGVAALWQLFLVFAVALSDIAWEGILYGSLCSLPTAAVLYISLKIRPTRPVTKAAEGKADSD